jgi:hypothetical protein
MRSFYVLCAINTKKHLYGSAIRSGLILILWLALNTFDKTDLLKEFSVSVITELWYKKDNNQQNIHCTQ